MNFFQAAVIFDKYEVNEFTFGHSMYVAHVRRFNDNLIMVLPCGSGQGADSCTTQLLSSS